MKLIILSFLVTVVVLGSRAERIYSPPPNIRQPQIQATTAKPTPASYAQAVNPNRNVPVPVIPQNVNPQIVRQGTGDFLPQNLTFILSARDLKNKGVDPLIKVTRIEKNGTLEVAGKTEPLDNNPNPDFLKVFWIIWKKGTQQKVKFEVRDVDSFRRDDPLGNAIIDLDDYVARNEKLNVTLQNGTGTLLIQKVTPVKFQLYARNLPNADTIGHSDPYVEAYWSVGSKGKKIKFATTPTIENNENPDWNLTIEFPNWIKGTDQWWTFKVYDSDPAGSDDLGEAIMEIDPFVAKRQTKQLTLGKSGNAKLAVTPA